MYRYSVFRTLKYLLSILAVGYNVVHRLVKEGYLVLVITKVLPLHKKSLFFPETFKFSHFSSQKVCLYSDSKEFFFFSYRIGKKTLIVGVDE